MGLTDIQRLHNNDPTLTEYWVHKDSLNSQGGVTALAEVLKINRILQKLTLGGIVLRVDEGILELANALKVNRTLQRLELYITLESKGCQAIAEALRVNYGLQQLILKSVSDEAGNAFAETLKVNRTLLTLHLTHSKLNDRVGIAFAEALKVNSSLQELNLESNEFRSEAGKAFAAALKVNHTLHTLNLQNNGIGRPLVLDLEDGFEERLDRIDKEVAWAFGEALKVNKSLKYLNLQKGALGNPVGTAIAAALKVNCTLIQLDLSRNNLTAEGGWKLAEALKVNRTLQKLDLADCNLSATAGKDFAEALKVNSVLLELSLNQNNRFDAEAGKALAGVLKVNHTLQKLGLSFNNLGDEVGKTLAEALKVNRSLQQLVLSSNNFGDEVGKALAEALKVNHTLLRLDLYGNKIGTEGGKALGEALKVNRALQDLSLQSNILGAEGGKAIAVALKVNRNLLTLNLWSNNLNAEVIKAFAQTLKVNHTLQLLFLGRDDLSTEEGIELANALKINSTLQKLYLSKNKLGIEGAKAFVEALQINRTLLDLSLINIPEDLEKEINASLKRNKQLAKAQEEKEKNARKVPALIQAALPLPAGVPQPKPVSLVQPLPAKQELEVKQLAAVTPFLAPADLDKLRALPAAADVHRAAAAARTLETMDAVALQALEGRAAQLQHLFEIEAKTRHLEGEMARIETDPMLNTYFQYFSRLLTGTWLACQSINSGMVENSDYNTSDYIASGLNKIGTHVPGIGVATALIEEIVHAWNDRDRKHMVQRLALLFPDLETAFKNLGMLARQLTLAQETTLKRISIQPKGFVGKVKEGLRNAQAAILASDIDNPVKRKAVEDCRAILTAIKEGRPKLNPTIPELLTVLLGAGFVYQPIAALPVSAGPGAITAAYPTAAVEASAPSLTQAFSEMQREMQQMRQRMVEAEKSAQLAQEKAVRAEEEAARAKKMAKDLGADDTVVPGGNSAQLLASATSASHGRGAGAVQEDIADLRHQVNAIHGQVTTLTHLTDEHAGHLDDLRSGQKALKRKPAEPQGCCSVL